MSKCILTTYATLSYWDIARDFIHPGSLSLTGAFNILAYTTRLDTNVPLEWQDSDARLIAEGKAEQVKMRSFSTGVHKVDAVVAYMRGEDD
jgi:hypothetical protein